MKQILFNTDMVRAILAGRKTVTRRVVKGYALEHLELDTDGSIIGVYDQFEGHVLPVMDYSPYRPGDVLYVRETWAKLPVIEDGSFLAGSSLFYYKADKNNPSCIKWRPSIHMPREAARIFLQVTDVRVERLQDMPAADIKRDFLVEPTALRLMGKEKANAVMTREWNSTIKPTYRALYGWTANPWVWVIEFQRISREEAMS